jgi:hypothetical protein
LGFIIGTQVQVHLSAGVRLQRVRLLVDEEGEQEDAQQGRGEGDHAGLGEGPQHLLTKQRLVQKNYLFIHSRIF